MPRHSLPNAIHASGPFLFLNPTTRYHPVSKPPWEQKQEPQDPGHIVNQADREGQEQIYHVWRSRDNRKGRRRVAYLRKQDGGPVKSRTDHYRSQGRKLALGVGKMVTRFPVWDVTYLVAVAFVLGSVIWVINGFFVWLPLARPESEFSGETDIAAGILAFLGTTVFEIGSVLMVIEAINAERSDCFGWELEEELEDHGLRLHPRHEGCRHGHQNRQALLRDSAVAMIAATTVDTVAEPGGLGPDGDEKVKPEKERRWSWWPTRHELTTHYIKEIGFLASLIQLMGATVFWMAGFTNLPGIHNAISLPVTNGTYWLPQVVGGTGFIVSSILLMVEVQDKWYTPAPTMLGWHVGFWNLVGAIGFTVCGALGFAAEFSTAVEYASAMSTFAGSWAFLVCSAVQWYEALDKYSISVEDSFPWFAPGEEGV
ncbi:Integral membrane protein [Madurella fahalii]|uniref:Integral membrane protein n=1 Tax=Madurella fahalii TaxID=1157608 RepID=A0ABQ0G840_9PEZI